MSMIKFFLNFEPDIPKKTHQVGLRAGLRAGKPVLYKDEGYRQLEALFDAKLARFAPPKPLLGPVELITTWAFRGADDCDVRYRTKKPDTDNLVKLLKDRMTACGYWKDDAQVCREMIEKIDVPPSFRHGVTIVVTPMESKAR